MADTRDTATQATPTLTLERVNTPPAQTWNYLKSNDVTLVVPRLSRKGDVYFALPRLFERVETGMGQEVTRWAGSQAQDATYIEVKPGEKHAPIVITLDARGGEVSDTGVMVRSGAEAQVVVVAHGVTEHPATTGALVRVIAEEDSRVDLTEVVAQGDASQHLESVGIEATEGARINIRQYFLGAGTTADGLCVTLSGDGARVDLESHYLGRGAEVLDLNHVVRMKGERGRANLAETGILHDSAHKSLRATIDLVHGASGSAGSEAETVLVAGDDVVNKTMPVILCDEDDVSGEHGATIGSVDGEQMDYLVGRGLSRQQAEDLFVRALFDDALIHAANPVARQAIFERARVVLGDEDAADLLDTLDIELEAGE